MMNFPLARRPRMAYSIFMPTKGNLYNNTRTKENAVAQQEFGDTVDWNAARRFHEDLRGSAGVPSKK